MHSESSSLSVNFDLPFLGDEFDGFDEQCFDEFRDQHDVDVLENLSSEVASQLTDRQCSTSSTTSLRLDNLLWPSSPPPVNNDFYGGDPERYTSNENIPPAWHGPNENIRPPCNDNSLLPNTPPVVPPPRPAPSLVPPRAHHVSGRQMRPRKFANLLVPPSRDWSSRVETKVPPLERVGSDPVTAPFTPPPSIRDGSQEVAGVSRLSPEQQQKHKDWAVKRKRVKPGTSYKYKIKAAIARKRRREDGKFETRESALRMATQAARARAPSSSTTHS